MPNEPDHTEQDVIIVEDETLRAGFTQIPNAILRRPDVSAGAKLTYMALLSYAWQQGSCFPGQDRLAEDTGAGKRSVVRYLQELQVAGLLVVKRRGLGRTNIYTLPKLSGTSRSANLALQEMPKTTHQEVPNWHTKNTQKKNTQKEKISNIRKASHIKEMDQTDAHPVEEATSGKAGFERMRETLRHRQPATQEYDEDRQVIGRYLMDFSRDLGDNAPLRSSVTRAVNLLHTLGVHRDTFVVRMFEAKAKALEEGKVRNRRDGNGVYQPPARMALWFACLEEVLGVQDDSGSDPSQPTAGGS